MASLKDLILSLSPEQQHYIARLVASMPESEGGLGLHLKNTAAQRAALGGYDVPMYHLTAEDFPEFDVSKTRKSAGFGPGIYAAKEPKALEGWAKKSEGVNVLPLLANTKNVLPLQNLSPEQTSKLSAYLGREISPETGIPYFSLEKRGGSVAEGAEQAGFSGVEHVGPGSTGEHVVFRDPSVLRSKFAAFNPWMKDEANLLASHPLASAGAALAATGGLSGMARNYLDQPYDPLDQYAQYGLEAPMKRGEALKNVASALPGVGDVLSGVEGLQAASEGKWGEAGLGALGALPMVGAIKASHGSPHAHTKFDFSKIGTGEGAQAYGHGGYFAQGFDSPVAQEYQQALSRQAGLFPKIGNKSLTDFYNEISRKADRLPIDKAGQEYEKLAFLEDLDLQPSFEDALARIDDKSIIPWAKALKDKYQPAGHLYNVSLEWPNAARESADPLGEHHLVDWDAPYEQQSSHIQELLKNYYNDVVNKRTNIREGLQAKFAAQGKVAPIREEMSPVTGQQLYDQIASQLNSRELASNYLAEKGIPGIRYLDQGSRSAGKSTRNYVIFDENIPRIVSRNGVSLTDLLKK